MEHSYMRKIFVWTLLLIGGLALGLALCWLKAEHDLGVGFQEELDRRFTTAGGWPERNPRGDFGCPALGFGGRGRSLFLDHSSAFPSALPDALLCFGLRPTAPFIPPPLPSNS